MFLWPCLVALWALGTSAGPVRDSASCYADNTNPYLKFGSKSAYEFIHPNNVTAEIVPDCEPLQVWMLSRHGTRYPKLSSIQKLRDLADFRDDILDNHNSRKKKGELCTKDLENLKTWQFNVSDSDQKNLTPQGRVDLRNLAQRLKTKFPSLLSSNYSSDLYVFRFTDTERTKESAENFVEGLFGSTEGVYFADPVDALLRPYSNCTRWVQEVEENDDAMAEASEFKDGDIVKDMKKAVTKRLGFSDRLKYKRLDKMYDMCRFDKAWNVSALSPWCAVFSEDDLKVMEYYEDVYSYYEESYGHEINVKLGCTPVKDFMERFSQLAGEVKTENKQPAGVFYFSHSTMLHMLQASLGVYKDSEPLLDSNYETMQNRQYRLSNIGTFASNIEAVFYKCTAGETYRVKFYESELPLQVEGCDEGLCSWEQVKTLYSEVAQQCNLDFCDLS